MWQSNMDKLFHLIQKKGVGDYLGEPVSIIDHITQAAMGAEENGESKEVILGAFLHDIGHMLDTSPHEKMFDRESKTYIGVSNHAALGAQYLEALGFPASVTNPVKYHVMAKKYLCAVDPNYAQSLSWASKQTLLHQGGPMNQKQVREFEKIDDFQAIVRVRRYDDQAKNPDMKSMKSLEYYKNMALELKLNSE